LGGLALIQPSSKALSMIAHSMFLMVTAGALMPGRDQRIYTGI
jgi:hypothetical protein